MLQSSSNGFLEKFPKSIHIFYQFIDVIIFYIFLHCNLKNLPHKISFHQEFLTPFFQLSHDHFHKNFHFLLHKFKMI